LRPYLNPSYHIMKLVSDYEIAECVCTLQPPAHSELFARLTEYSY
jgi:hypothetical protein